MDLHEFIDSVLLVYCVYIAYLYTKERKALQTRDRNWWVRPENLDRKINGFFEISFERFKTSDPIQFQKATGMSVKSFDVLLNLLREKLTKYSIRTPISPECRLFLTLLHLSEADSRKSLAETFKLGISTVRIIIFETCEAIWESLSTIYLSPPDTKEWKMISLDFESMWNLPNCVGAVDATFIEVAYKEKKETFGIVMSAACDAHYVFTAVDIIKLNSESIAGVFTNSDFGKQLLTGKLNLPNRRSLDSSGTEYPYYFIASTTFPLKENLMRPYPGLLIKPDRDNFNKRLAHGRRTIDNAFGILKARWRILQTTINVSSEFADVIVKAAVVLHNFLKTTDDSYCPRDFADHMDGDKIIDGLWRQEVKPPSKKSKKYFVSQSNRSSNSAFQCREALCAYFASQ